MTAHEPRTASVGHTVPTCRHGRAGAPCGIPLVASRRVRLSDLDPIQRELVLALIGAAKGGTVT